MTDGERITGVLDRTNACAGDPRADLDPSLYCQLVNAVHHGT
jgi:aminoglycoside phosphotransferase (APT) family kinase protein